MTTTNWKIGHDGTWNKAVNWFGGVPNAGVDVLINAPGSYTLTLSGAGAANNLILNAAGAKLRETTGASLSVGGQLTLSAGTLDAMAGASLQVAGPLVVNGGTLFEAAGASLNLGGFLSVIGGVAQLGAANTIASGVGQSGGVIVATDSAALGSGTYQFQGGTFLAGASITIANKLFMQGNDITFAAAHGAVLDLNSAQPWSLNIQNIHFGAAGADGTVVWHTGPAGGAVVNQAYNIAVDGGTLKGGGDFFFPALFQSNTGSVTVAAGAVLDINGIVNNPPLNFHHLHGAGTIANSGALTTLQVFGDSFSGTIRDAIAVGIFNNTVTLSGTNTYTGGTTVTANGTLQLGAGGTTGSVAGTILVGSGSAVIYDHSGSFVDTNVISGAGKVTFEGGANTTINQASTYTGGTTTQSGSFSIGDGGAFGSGALTLGSGSSIIATTDETLGVSMMTMTGTTTFAAAHGKTLTNVAAGTTWIGDGTQQGPVHTIFGDAGHDGTVVWNTGGASLLKQYLQDTVEVQAGTLKAGDGNFYFLLSYGLGVTVDSGATIDTNGFNTKILNLTGAGSVIGHGGTTVNLLGGAFAGAIAGAVGVQIDNSVVLTGTNTYTGGTVIDALSALSLGQGGNGGSVAGDIVDNGSLFFDHANTMTVTAAISGTGDVNQYGLGKTVINRAESYSGGTNVLAGQLSIGEADAIGSGALTLDGGGLVTTATMAITNALLMSDDVTIAASKGTTLTMNAGAPWSLDASNPASLTFGESAHKGTVVWMSPVGSAVTGSSGYSLTIAGGTLKDGDGALNTLTFGAESTTVGAAGTLDLAGANLSVNDLLGSGLVVDSGAAATLHIYGGAFSGALNGPLALDISGSVTLTGGGSYTAAIVIEQGSTLDLADTKVRAVTFTNYNSTLNVIEGAGKAETVNVALAGGDTVTGGAGNETFNLTSFALSDRIDGGGGNDVVSLNGDYAGYTALVLTSDVIVNVEALSFVKGHDYTITSHDMTVATGQTLAVDASALKAANHLIFNGAAETDGHFLFTGGLGSDDLTGGALSDTFVYSAAGQSSGNHYDTIRGFDFDSDRFDLPDSVSEIETSASHALSSGSFDGDLAAAVSGHLVGHSAMFVAASSGSLAGHTFLVVDLNGTAGYQSGADLVIDMVNATGTLATGDFV